MASLEHQGSTRQGGELGQQFEARREARKGEARQRRP